MYAVAIGIGIVVNLPSAQPMGRRLAGRLIAVSISEADDLVRLGFPDDQMDRVLQALLVPLVCEGGAIAYGGRIEHPHNFTLVLSDNLGETYRRLEQQAWHRPFVHFVAQHRFVDTVRQTPDVLLGHLRRLAPYGEIRVTGEQGVLATFAALGKRGADIVAIGHDASDKATSEAMCRNVEDLVASPACRHILQLSLLDKTTSYSDMRRQMASLCDARVQVGGRTSGFSGAMSGLCEEASLTIAASRPLLVLGGFGGASRDIAAALGLIDPAACVPPAPAPDRAKYEAGLALLQAVRLKFEAIWTSGPLGRVQELARTESVIEAVELVAQLLGQRFPPVDACTP